jgi:hypothetical protein
MTTNPVSEKDQIDWNATVIFDGSNVVKNGFALTVRFSGS